MNENVQDAISKLSNDIQNNRNDLNMSQTEITEIQKSVTRLQGNLNSSYLILLTAVGISIAGIVLAAYLFNILRFKKGMLEGV